MLSFSHGFHSSVPNSRWYPSGYVELVLTERSAYPLALQATEERGESFCFPKDGWLSSLDEDNTREENWHCPKDQSWTCTNGDLAPAQSDSAARGSHWQNVACAFSYIGCLPVAPDLTVLWPKWVYGKRAIVEPARLLAAKELRQRVCDYFGCEQLELLTQKLS